jgi:hypothetical protein
VETGTEHLHKLPVAFGIVLQGRIASLHPFTYSFIWFIICIGMDLGIFVS